jgi:hypothetical protein
MTAIWTICLSRAPLARDLRIWHDRQTFAEIEKLGRARSLVLSTPNQKTDAEVLAQRLGALCVGVFADAAMHTPVHITELALASFTSGEHCLIAWEAVDHRTRQSDRRPHRPRTRSSSRPPAPVPK